MSEDYNNIIGKTICFEHNNTRYERAILEVLAVYSDSWSGDLGWDDDSEPAISFIVHGDLDNGSPVLRGLCVQFDDMRTAAHGTIGTATVK